MVYYPECLGGGNNYVNRTLTAKLVIAKATLPTITFEDVSFVYDGLAKSIFIGGTLPNGVTVNYSGNGQTEAGIYTVTAEIDGGNNYGNKTLTADLGIAKANLPAITFEDVSLVYDGLAKSIFIGGTLPNGATVTYSGNEQIKAGAYTITAEIDGGNNYVNNTLTADLGIAKATLPAITFEDVSLVYDGLAKSILIEQALPNGVTVNYLGNGQTKAGAYTITAEIDGGNNYVNKTLIAKLSIAKATLPAIAFEAASLVYDGLAKSLSISGTLPEQVSVVYNNNSRIDAGSQEVTATISGADYGKQVLRAELKITKAQAIITADEQQVHSFMERERR